MAQNDPQAESLAQPKRLDPFPVTLADTGKRVEDMINLQTAVFEYLQEANRNWFARMQSETAIASEFATKLAASCSLPETAGVCQEWTNRRIGLLSEDGKRLFAETQKLVEAGARVLGNGWTSGANAKA